MTRSEWIRLTQQTLGKLATELLESEDYEVAQQVTAIASQLDAPLNTLSQIGMDDVEFAPPTELRNG